MRVRDARIEEELARSEQEEQVYHNVRDVLEVVEALEAERRREATGGERSRFIRPGVRECIEEWAKHYRNSILAARTLFSEIGHNQNGYPLDFADQIQACSEDLGQRIIEANAPNPE